MSVQSAQKLFDDVVGGALEYTRERGHRVACARGCAACCNEPVYAERREAQGIVDALAGKREELAKQVGAWWSAFFAAGLSKQPRARRGEGYRSLMAYRSAKIGCPVLAGNLCSAYPARPIACRSHLALKSKQYCEDDRLRPQQQYVDVDPKAHVVALYMFDPDHAKSLVEFDHLGIWLGHILLGKKERSAAAEDRFLDNVEVESWLGGQNDAGRKKEHLGPWSY